jgi:hypothetical protein
MTAMAIRDNVMKMVVSYGEVVSEEVVERTRVLWEEAYDEPYDLSGSELDARAVDTAREAFHWDTAASEEDANRLYKGLQPRFLMEVFQKSTIFAKKQSCMIVFLMAWSLVSKKQCRPGRLFLRKNHLLWHFITPWIANN